MIEHRSQLRFTTPDKYQPLADKEAIGKKVQELTNRPDEELTDSDCFELASDILTQATGTHFRGTSSFQWEYEYTDYSIFTKEPAGYPITFKVWDQGMYENDEGDLVPLAQNDQRIDISLRLLPSNTEMPHPYEENFSFTRTFGGVIGREDSPGSISFVSAPLVPGKRRTIISALAGTLDDNPATVADTGEFVGPLW